MGRNQDAVHLTKVKLTMLCNDLVPSQFQSVSMVEDHRIVGGESKVPNLAGCRSWVNAGVSESVECTCQHESGLWNRHSVPNDLEDKLHVVGHVKLLRTSHQRSKSEGGDEGPPSLIQSEESVQPPRLQVRHMQVVLAPVGCT